jgi:hypothetical protein
MLKKERRTYPFIYLFNACNGASEAEKKISLETGIILIEGIPEYLIEQSHGREVAVRDGHWNKLGNQIVGERLVSILSAPELLRQRSNRRREG